MSGPINREVVAAEGVELAQRALRHLADGREGEALATLNDGSHGEVTWAAAYLMSALRESLAARFGSPAQVRWAIHQATRDPGDELMTRVGVVLDDAKGV